MLLQPHSESLLAIGMQGLASSPKVLILGFAQVLYGLKGQQMMAKSGCSSVLPACPVLAI